MCAGVRIRHASSLLEHKTSQFIVRLLFILLPAACTITTTTGTVVLGDDGSANAFDLLVLFLNFLCISLRIGVNPRLAILQCIHNLLLLLGVELLTETLVLARSLDG